jgi:flavodoxin
MAATLVTYFSRTGNTRAVAEAIYDEITGEKALRSIAEAGDLAPYTLLFIGFPVHTHSVAYQVELFLKRVPEGKKLALFSTHGSVTGGVLSREALEYASTLITKSRIIGTFSCRGKVAIEALEVLKKSPEHAAWADMAASAATHPDANDLAEARAFARWVTALSLED